MYAYAHTHIPGAIQPFIWVWVYEIHTLSTCMYPPPHITCTFHHKQYIPTQLSHPIAHSTHKHTSTHLVHIEKQSANITA